MWEGSDRRQRLPDDWWKLVAQVKKRDGGRCTWRLKKSRTRCPREGTDVDHRVPNDDHSLANLQLLCAHHHAAKSSMEGRRARAQKAASRYRPAEEHPGNIG